MTRKSPSTGITLASLLDHMRAMEGRLQTELKQGIGSVRSDVAGVRSNVGSVRSDVASVRSNVVSMRSNIGSVRSDLAKMGTHLNARIDRVERDISWIKVSIGNIDKRLDTIEVVQVPRLEKAIGMRRFDS